MKKDKTVLVTGAGTGIGRASAIRLGKAGFNVILCYRKSSEGAKTALEEIAGFGGSGELLQLDVTDRKKCEQRLGEYCTNHQGIWGIVVNAGITRDGPLASMTAEDWDDVLNTDLNGFYNVVKPLIMPMVHLRNGGRIVAVSSVAGLIGACKALALELASRKITVNCIAPGLIDTDMAQLRPEAKETIMNLIPLKRMGKPEEVAAAIAFLMSDDAAYITRQTISINGGLS